MSIKQGLICEFLKRNWTIDVDSSPALYNISTVDTLLSCDIGYYHSINVTNAFVLFNFSKAILIHSYTVYSNEETMKFNYLYNWNLTYYDEKQNKWDVFDRQTQCSTLGKTDLIQLKHPVIAKSIKLIGGLDPENDSYYLKFSKIEFYGHVDEIFTNNFQHYLFTNSLFLLYSIFIG